MASDSFAFDRDGNLSTLGTYDPVTGRMVTPPPVSYDRDGNLLHGKDVGGTFGYDALDRLVADGSVSKYAYDVLGRRIAKRVYSGPDAGYVRYLYRGGEVAAEADSGGTLKRAYTWGLGADNLVAIHDYVGGDNYYVGQDQLSSTRWVVRSDGTWQMTLRYTSYGALIDSTGTLPFPLRYRWIGREYDEETGLYYLRARYYAPSIARFIQEDPGGHATTSNAYAYGEGNPTNGRDLSGMMVNAIRFETPPPILSLADLGLGGNDFATMDEGGGFWDRLDAQAAADDIIFAAARLQTLLVKAEAALRIEAQRGGILSLAAGMGLDLLARISADFQFLIKVQLYSGSGSALPIVTPIGTTEALIRLDLLAPSIGGPNRSFTPEEVVAHEVAERALIMWNDGNAAQGMPGTAFAHNTAVALIDDPMLAGEGYTSRTSRTGADGYVSPLTPLAP